MNKHTNIIAEIGCCHLGSIARAKLLCKLAIESGADYVKSQKRNVQASTPKELWNQPHPNPQFAYGATYLEHRTALELHIQDHREIADYCKSIGGKYCLSVWDVPSALETINHLSDSDLIKVPSACNNNELLIKTLLKSWPKQIHISTGMTSNNELNQLLKWIDSSDRRKDIVLYGCTSAYPCDFKDACLLEMKQLKNAHPQIGYSDHTKGIMVPVAAVALGATWIEKHFVDDRTLRHTDASNSLEPEGFKKMVRDIRHLEDALGYKPREGLLQCELGDRSKMKQK